MANGSTRIALANIQLNKEAATAEQAELKKLDKGNLPKYPLKSGKK